MRKDLSNLAFHLRAAADSVDAIGRFLERIERRAIIDGLTEEVISGDPRLRVNLSRAEVIWKGHHVPDLSARMGQLVGFLAERPGIVRTRDQILDLCFKENGIDVLDRSVDSLIKRIRRRFERVDPDFDAIRTVYNLGYKWELEP